MNTVNRIALRRLIAATGVAIFSLVGIALGVATLIVVSSVMSGFQAELVSRVLGVNGHVTIETLSA